MKKLLLPITAIAAAFAAVGCLDPATAFQAPAATPQPDSPVVREAKQLRPDSQAGVRLDTPPAGGPLWVNLVNEHSFSSRPDPFALQPKEQNYDRRMLAERVFSMSDWDVRFEPKEETVVTPEIEPQPYRRLAGVIVGDSILALIDMGNGKLELIRPGQEIQGWRVASIDSEKAVLRRAGNKLPHEVVVRLEEPPLGGNPGGSPGGGQPGGGGPGAVPGGGDDQGGE